MEVFVDFYRNLQIVNCANDNGIRPHLGRQGPHDPSASVWPLRDDHTAQFFERLYAKLGQGLPLDRALAQTQVSLREDGFPVESYAPFVLLGDGTTSWIANPNPPRRVSKGLWAGAMTGLFLLLGGAFVFRRRLPHRQGQRA